MATTLRDKMKGLPAARRARIDAVTDRLHDEYRTRHELRRAHEFTQEEELSAMTEIELLRTHAATIDELMRRGVVKTRNNPIGDYTVWRVCRALNLDMESNRNKSFDAIDDRGGRYKIKGRQEESSSVQLSVIRNLDDVEFDVLIAVVFNNDYSIRLAVRVPHKAVARMSKFRRHVNGHVLTLTDSTKLEADVSDITEKLRDSGRN